MPSQSPNKTIEAFKKSVDEHTGRFSAVTDLVAGTGGSNGFTELQLRRGLAVDYFFRVATDWQIFQDAWSIKAVAHKPAGFLKTYEKRFEDELSRTATARDLRHFTDVAISVPSLHSTLSETRVRQIVDAEGRNLEFASSALWSTWAKKYLADPHKSKLVRLLNDDTNTSLLDLVRQIRNYIAHRSSAGLSQIQDFATKRSSDGEVGVTGKRNAPIAIERQYQIRDVGTYLDRALGEPYYTPARFIAIRLSEFAESLRWS